MIYGYIRVSTDKQTVENQRFEIETYCRSNGISVNEWIDETVSGRKEVSKRELGKLLYKMTKGDVLICSELSRLGRNLLMIMGVLNECMNREIQIWTIKESYRLGNDITCKVLAFAFGLSAEIERNLISQRTKEALLRKKSEGVKLGKPRGSVWNTVKMDEYEDELKILLEAKIPISSIAQHFNTNKMTIYRYMRRQDKLQKNNLTVKGGQNG